MPRTRSWRLLSSRTLGTSPVGKVTANRYRTPSGTEVEDYLVLHDRSGAMVFALTDDREVLLVRQYRAPVEEALWELPAGMFEENERDVLGRAKAELRQETGFEAREWRELGVILPAPHRLTERTYCFLALGAHHAGSQDLDSTESVEWELRPLDQVRRLVADGTITSAPTLAVIAKAMIALD